LDLQGRRFSFFFFWVRAVLVNIDLKRSDAGRLSRPDMAISFLILRPPACLRRFCGRSLRGGGGGGGGGRKKTLYRVCVSVSAALLGTHLHC